VLDFAYYNRLLLGAVEALLKVEQASKGGNRLSELTLSTDVEAAVKRPPGGNEYWSRAKGRWIFYLIVLLVLLAGMGVSLYARSSFAVQPALAAAQAAITGSDPWWWSNGPADWALVLIGTVAAGIALVTLFAIKRQVTANVNAANAAKETAETGKQSAETAAKEAEIALQQVAIMAAQLQHERSERLKEHKPIAFTDVVVRDDAPSYQVCNVGTGPAVNVWFLDDVS
jgi:hypothetical protein